MYKLYICNVNFFRVQFNPYPNVSQVSHLKLRAVNGNGERPGVMNQLTHFGQFFSGSIAGGTPKIPTTRMRCFLFAFVPGVYFHLQNCHPFSM